MTEHSSVEYLTLSDGTVLPRRKDTDRCVRIAAHRCFTALGLDIEYELDRLAVLGLVQSDTQSTVAGERVRWWRITPRGVILVRFCCAYKPRHFKKGYK